MEVAMTPMIDVVFLLLIFFVWTASFQIAEQLLPSELTPPTGTGNAVQPDPEMIDFELVVVTISWPNDAPVWQVNGVSQDSLATLRQTLTAIARAKSDLPVVLDPEPQVPLGYVIEVFDVARSVGFSKVQFAAAEDP
jgi:biopolymer transport protein ExbD